MALLANLNTTNALMIHGVNAALKLNTNATNEITIAERANRAWAPDIIDDPLYHQLFGCLPRVRAPIPSERFIATRSG